MRHTWAIFRLNFEKKKTYYVKKLYYWGNWREKSKTMQWILQYYPSFECLIDIYWNRMMTTAEIGHWKLKCWTFAKYVHCHQLKHKSTLFQKSYFCEQNIYLKMKYTFRTIAYDLQYIFQLVTKNSSVMNFIIPTKQKEGCSTVYAMQLQTLHISSFYISFHCSSDACYHFDLVKILYS